LIAQLRGNTIVDEIRQAVAAHVTALKAHPSVIARADDAIREIEAEAALLGPIRDCTSVDVEFDA